MACFLQGQKKVTFNASSGSISARKAKIKHLAILGSKYHLLEFLV